MKSFSSFLKLAAFQLFEDLEMSTICCWSFTGSNDPDDLIVRAFKAYELEGGKIEAEMFRHVLMNFGDKFSKAEVDDIFGEFEVDDDGFIESKAVIGLFVAGGGEKKEEEPAKEEAAAEAPAEGDAAPEEGAKKKKKKKKAAK